jgi:hypothetical protein
VFAMSDFLQDVYEEARLENQIEDDVKKAVNGNTLHPVVMLKFRSGIPKKRARKVMDAVRQVYPSARLIQKKKRLFCGLNPENNDTRFIYIMMFCKDFVDLDKA